MQSLAVLVAVLCVVFAASPAAAAPPGTVPLAPSTVPGTLTVALVGTTPGSVWITSSFDWDEAPQFLRVTGTTVTTTRFYDIPNCCGLQFTGGPYLWACDGGGCDWLSVDTDAHGRVPQTWGQPYPNGGLYVSNGDLFAQSYAQIDTGDTTDLGPPGTIYRILTGPDGAVVFANQDETTASYYPYGGSGPVLLATPDGAALSCSSVSSTGVGCYDSAHHAVVRLPMDGGAAVSTPVPTPPSRLVATATATGWLEPDGLHTAPAAGGTESVQAVSDVTGLSTDGSAFYFTRSGRYGTAGLYRSYDATTTPIKVYTAPRKPRHAGNVALSAGRVAWADNQSDQQPIWSRPVMSIGRFFLLGARTPVADSDLPEPWSPDPLTPHSLSGSRLLWGSSSGPAENDQVANVSTPDGDLVLPELAQSLQRLSGTRVLYRAADGHERVYDLVHQTTLDVTSTYAAVGDVDLSGNYLVYATASGAIWRADLSGAATPQQVLGPVPAGYTMVGRTVATDGDWVAWTRTYRSGPTWVTASGYRDARTMGPTVALPNAESFTPLSASPDGVVYVDAATAGRPWILKPWTQPAITLPQSGSMPSVYGSLVGWTDRNGTPKISPLPTRFANRPRSLGNPYAATNLVPGHTWSFDLVTTAPLTSCAVKITDARGVTVRTRPCQATAMRLGEAVTSWNGLNDTGHTAGPGTYHWTVVARNFDGTMLAADGSAQATTGMITVQA